MLFDKEDEDEDVVVDEVRSNLARKRSRKVKLNALKKNLGPTPTPIILISYIMFVERVITKSKSMS